MQVPLLLLAILGAMFIRLESSSAPNSPPPVSFRATLACFSVPSDPTPTPEPTPTPTPTPTPDPCADWEAPPLISDSGSSPASFRGHSGEWYAENPPDEAELDEDDLNILVEHASVWGYRTGYLGFEEPEPEEPRNVYLTMDKTKKTTVRRTQGDSIRTCGSYEETTTDSYDNTQETRSWQATTVTGSHWLWHYANHIQSDTFRTSGSDYENVLYTTTLSQPYDVPAFQSDLGSLAPFIDVFHQSWLNHHLFVWTNENQTYSDVDMVRFKWKWGANVAPEDRYAPPTYLVVFIPPDDPDTEDIDESENAELIKTISWATWDTATQSPVYEINPFEHKGLERGEYRLLPFEFKKIYEENNPVNFVHDTTPKDDPPPLSRNILYTVIVPQSLDYHLKLEMEIPETFRTKFMWAVVNNQNQTAGEGFFPADGPADVVFDHNASESRGDYDVFVGYDANSNSVLDESERTTITVPKLNQPLKIHGVNSQAYAESNIAIATGGILGGYVAPIAEALLDIFFFGDASQVESGWQPTSTTTVSFSCFSGDWSDWLTHNAGAGFNASGDATIKLYTWDSSTQASNKLASAPAIKDNLLAMHGLKQSQIASALEGSAVGTEMSFPSDTGWYEFPLDRITFQEQLTHMDEYLAVARARISGFKVRFKAKKTSSGVDIIETVTTGVIEDLYDFNYIAGFLSQRAATIQLSHGNGSFENGREAGQIYRNRFEFYKTWNGLP